MSKVEWKDAVHTTVTVHLSWWDRFKVLVGAPLYVAVRTLTEFEVGAFETDSHAWTHPWRLWRGPELGGHTPESDEIESDKVKP